MKALSLLFAGLLAFVLFARPHPYPCHHRRKDPHPRTSISWKAIAAGGAAAGTVVAAYKISDGYEEGLKTAAKEKPEAFLDSLPLSASFLRWVLIVALCVAGYVVWRKYSTISKKGFSNETGCKK